VEVGKEIETVVIEPVELLLTKGSPADLGRERARVVARLKQEGPDGVQMLTGWRFWHPSVPFLLVGQHQQWRISASLDRRADDIE
jgi:hypothetical protein